LGDLDLILGIVGLNMSNDMDEVANSVMNLVLSGSDVTVKHGELCKDCGKNDRRYPCRSTGEDCRPFGVVTITSKRIFGFYK